MSKVSRSPERFTFQKEAYMRRCEEQDKEPSQAYLDFYDDAKQRDLEWEQSNDHDNDLEYDLRTTEWICQKARSSDSYAQNLYAAMCNTEWQKREVLPILKDQTWSCTWRYAGGIVADMREEGDYIDWYCSGIREAAIDEESEVPADNGFVSEGTVTEEIADDLYSLGWVCKETHGEEHV